MSSSLEEIIACICQYSSTDCLVIFGSGGRSDLLPGSDLDIVAVVPYKQSWKYVPTIIEDIWIDLNYVCNEGLSVKLASSWYWRAQLRRYKIVGNSTITSQILRLNDELGRTEAERKLIRDGWIQLSNNYYTNARNCNAGWIRQGMEWHAIVSLMNGILQLNGLTPHAYHMHLREIHKINMPEAVRYNYLNFVYSSYPELTEMPLWLTNLPLNMSDANLQIKIRATNERAKYLKEINHLSDIAFYMRHAIWMLLAHIACKHINCEFPTSNDGCGALLERIDSMLPEDIKKWFLRRGATDIETVRAQLYTLLINTEL